MLITCANHSTFRRNSLDDFIYFCILQPTVLQTAQRTDVASIASLLISTTIRLGEVETIVQSLVSKFQ
uniref:Uncharacterized protein n=1 Tax=Pararge aegeria TaxID=116150 RepID=S4NIR5_9NEOP